MLLVGLAPPASAASGLWFPPDSDSQMFWMEGVETAVVLNLSPASDVTVSVDYHTEPLTATEGVDYVYTSGTKYLTPGMLGTWIFIDTISDSIAEGDETFAIVLTNPVNASIVDGYGVVTIEDDDQDYTPPNTSIDSGPSGSTTDTNATFSFSASEASTFQCSLDGAGWSGCGSPAYYSGLSLGGHTFQVRATDLANNTDPTPASRAWTIVSSDTTPPNTTIDSGPSGSTTDTNAIFSFSASESATYQCAMDGSGWSGCSSPKSYSGLSLGGHTFQVRATDLANNTDPTPASRSWTIVTQGPSNDMFGNAFLLLGSSASRYGDTNVGATAEPGEPAHNGWHAAEHSVWYSWTAPFDGSVSIDTIGSDFDTVAAIYTGSSVSSLASVAYNDDIDYPANMQSLVTADVHGGTTYRIAVDGVIADVGTITLNLALTPAPPNDDFANATWLSGAAAARHGDTNVAATAEPGEPAHGWHAAEHSIWYRWTAPANGVVTLDTRDSDIDTMLAVYTGSPVGSLTSVAYDDDIDYPDVPQSEVVFDAVGGTTYRFAVDGVVYDDDQGSVDMHLGFVPRPSNDRFGDAQVLSGMSVTRTGDTNVVATAEPGEPAHDWHSAEHSVWYRWTPSQGGKVTVDTIGSSFDTVLAVYTGSSVSQLADLVSNDDISYSSNRASRVVFTAKAGTTYSIAVDGPQYDADQGAITLHLVQSAFVYKPDAMLRLSTSGVWVGNGVINTTGANQTVSTRGRRGASTTFVLAVHNDGTTTDTYRVRGPGASPGFTVTYLAKQSGATVITSSVVAGTYTLRLAPGAQAYLRLVVKVKTTAAIGATKASLVTFRSVALSTKADAVRGTVTVKS